MNSNDYRTRTKYTHTTMTI